MTSRAEPDFSGHTVWITGGASGQGASHVRRFAAARAKIGCIDVDTDGLKRLAAEVRSGGGVIETARADVSQWDQVAAAADQFRRALGEASVIIANAGIVGDIAPIETVDPGAWSRVLDVNLTGAFHTIKAAIPQLRAHSNSAIVLVASAASFFSFPRYAAYCASKAGMIGLLRAAANELGGDGIRVNAVCPGWVDTPMLDGEAEAAGLTRNEAVAGWVQEHILQRLITPDEVSDMVLWLASDSARMVTGAAVPIDAGQLVRRP
jgi:NAD(P)-dependent dehydrogenase (short-subunit alcohol dehydrogenase family)